MNGTFAWDADSSVLPLAFLPVTLLGLERAFAAARAGGSGGWRMLCAGLAYSVLAGFPELAYIDGILAVCWAALRFFQARGYRLGFLWRVALGGVVALLLCAPLLLAFFSFLGQMNLASRGFAHSSLATGNLAMMLFPYVNGPIFFQGHLAMWYSIDAFVGLPVLCLALAALGFAVLAKPPERALRCLLAAWIVLSVAKATNVPGITAAWNMVPMIAHAMFFRYADSSWAFCTIVLAAMGLHDLMTQDAVARRRAMLGAASLCMLAAIAVLLADRPVLRDLAGTSAGRVWIFASLGWGFCCAAILFAVSSARRFRPRVLAGLLLLDAALQFSVPLMAGTRGEARSLDLDSLGFLKSNIGLSRLYSLGPLTTNYGSYYRIAEINHDYAPVPVVWTRYIATHLDPLPNEIMFNGFAPAPADGEETRAEALRRRYNEFAALGVKYVAAGPGMDPFALSPASLHAPNSVLPVALQPGQDVSGSFPPGEYDPTDIASAGTILGTYGGHSTGRLSLTLCAASACASGSVVLDGFRDLSMAVFQLDHTLHLQAGQTLRFSFAHQGGTTLVALLAWRDAMAPRGEMSGPADITAAHMPIIQLWPPAGPDSPHLVFRGASMDIYQLPGTAPYFEAPGCTLHFDAREEVQADCPAPSHLLRRELYFPGWQARVDGGKVPIRAAREIFQQIDIPAGTSTIRYAFAPPFIGWGYAAALLGLLCLVGSFWKKVKSLLF